MATNKKLLYIAFIDLERPPTSGSSVRPLKMLAAFKEIGCEVLVLSGQNNDIAQRRRRIKEIKKALAYFRPDCCYIEPPSGPMFCRSDLALIWELHKEGVPIGLFYRDAYWKYTDYYQSKHVPILERLKTEVIKQMQISQLKFFARACDILYFPSKSMADEFDVPCKLVLPPGCFEPTISKPRDKKHKCLHALFVGGAAKNHGTYLTLEAFEIANRTGVRCELTYVCPQQQWTDLGVDAHDQRYKEWLRVVHASGDENLIAYYEWADITLLTAPRTHYRDFAVPVKLYEYMSYLKPMLVTDCIETAKVVNENKVGWVVKDNANDIANALVELSNNPSLVSSYRECMITARATNLWTIRAKKVIEELMEVCVK